MRRAIDRRSRQFKDVLLHDSLRREFLKNTPKNDAKVVKAFVAANVGNALKTRPKVSPSVFPYMQCSLFRLLFPLFVPTPCSLNCVGSSRGAEAVLPNGWFGGIDEA